MNAELRAQQQALLAALYAPGLEDAMNFIAPHAAPVRVGGQNSLKRGLQAYRAHGQALAQRALAAAHPVLEQLLGDENFEALACAFWQAQPPVLGDIARWGEALPAFIEAAPQLAQEPWLADVARVEWALHCAGSAADLPVDPGSLTLLADTDPADLLLRLAPGLVCLQSAWPVVSIANAHLEGQPSLALAGQRLQDGLAETALVWRQGYRPRLREAQAGEPAFLRALQAGASLADALAASPALDFNGWLLPAFQSGLLVGAAMSPACTASTQGLDS